MPIVYRHLSQQNHIPVIVNQVSMAKTANIALLAVLTVKIAKIMAFVC